MNILLKDIENRLGLDYEGFKNGYHVFTKLYMRQDKKSFQLFYEDECSICKKKMLKRRWMKTSAHMTCRNKLNGFIKRGKKRCINERSM